jgi:tRNA modification GTPase
MEDAICAIATPYGEGGIGIIRISGDKAIEVAAMHSRLRSGRSLFDVTSHTLYQADIFDVPIGGPAEAGLCPLPIDQGLVVVMRAPHSYTAEDVVEIHCHGGLVILHALCEAIVAGGARLAQPGEFTKRAFLNSKLDLAQAEAVLETIRAKTTVGLRLAQQQLRGSLSKKLDGVRERLIGLLAHVEAAIDFSEEDISFIAREELLGTLSALVCELSRLADTYREGRIFREGQTAVIVGRPNVGKSSLLNALLRTDRAIVTPVPGTTRDILEETLNIRGIPIRLLDTAGLHETDDAVEQEGIRRSRTAIEDADLLLVLLDGSAPLHCDQQPIVSRHEGQKLLLVINKIDLPTCLSSEALSDLCQRMAAESIVQISAKTGAGLDNLRDAIRSALIGADFEPGDTAILTSLRHRIALLKAVEALKKACESVDSQLSGEFVALDLRGALDALEELTGTTTTDDVLERVFSDFCVGK